MEPTSRANERLDTINSIHEAGHTVMAMLVGAKVRSVYLDLPCVDGRFGSMSRTYLGDEEELLIKFAGVGAELIYRGLTWTWLFSGSGKDDWERAQWNIDKIGGDRRKVVRDAETKVMRLLTLHWDWVLAVASELRAKRRMMEEELDLFQIRLRTA